MPTVQLADRLTHTDQGRLLDWPLANGPVPWVQAPTPPAPRLSARHKPGSSRVQSQQRWPWCIGKLGRRKSPAWAPPPPKADMGTGRGSFSLLWVPLASSQERM